MKIALVSQMSEGWSTAIMNVSGIATATSLMTLLYGIEFLSVVGEVITILFAGTSGVYFIKDKK